MVIEETTKRFHVIAALAFIKIDENHVNNDQEISVRRGAKNNRLEDSDDEAVRITADRPLN